MAFALIRYLQYKVMTHVKENFSAERIREELYRIQESILKDTTNGNRYVVPSKPTQDAIKIYETLNKNRNVIPFKLIT